MYVETYKCNKGPGVGVGSRPAGVPRRRGCDSDSVLVPPAQAHKEPLLSRPPQNPTRLIFINTQLSNIYQTIFNNW